MFLPLWLLRINSKQDNPMEIFTYEIPQKTKFFATICYNLLHSTDNNCAHSPRSRSSSLQLKANPSIRFSASLSYSYTLSHHTTFHLTRHITTTTPLHWQLYFLPTLFSTKRIFCVHYRLCWERKNEKSSNTLPQKQLCHTRQQCWNTEVQLHHV